MKFVLSILVIVLLTVAIFGVPKSIAAKITKPETFEMTGIEATELLHAKEQAAEALRTYALTKKAIHDAHKWDDDVLFNDRVDVWFRQPKQEVKPEAKIDPHKPKQ